MIDAPDIQYGDIIGHDRVVRLLKNAVATERVAHAYLFAGSQGVGKTKTAYAFAATLLCKTGGDEACGQCISCKKFVDANHPDLSELKPEEKTNGMIKVKPMREFIRNTHFHPFESDWKIFIIHESEKMNKESANTLLKTLEEPTKNTVIILLTNRPQQLLPTILSRCQKIVFGLLKTGAVARIVGEKRGLSEKDADIVARLAQGSVGRAMHMDLKFSTEDLPNFGQDFFSLRFGRDRKLFEFADAIGAWPSGPLEALEIVMSLLADAARIAAGIDADRLTYPDLREQAADFARSYSPRALAAKIRTVIYAQRLIERNANKRLTAEAMLMDILTPRVTRFSERLPR
jgi:DNA polymerase III subunit delta'